LDVKITGVLSGFVCSPMELVMIQQQRFGTSLLGTPSKIIAETGISGLLTRGLFMSCAREGVFTAGMLGVGPSMRRYASEKMGYSDANAAIFGAVVGGTIVATISHPMDTIKTCQQGDIGKQTYGSVVHSMKSLLSQEGGMRRFFSGWGWRTGRMILEIFIFDACKTRLSPLFFPHHFKE
jgi:solute carrier family 25 (mitochondrial carnitine/acylcarnitine transporter), member 20/29